VDRDRFRTGRRLSTALPDAREPIFPAAFVIAGIILLVSGRYVAGALVLTAGTVLTVWLVLVTARAMRALRHGDPRH
jgi:hypothetical protein